MPHRRTVAEWMSPPLLLDEQASVAEALAAVSNHASRHACVVRDGQLVGILSDRDLLRPAASAPGATAGHLMTPQPESVGPEAALAVAARLLLEQDVHCLPVVSGGRVLGMVTERELLRALLASLAGEAGRDVHPG